MKRTSEVPVDGSHKKAKIDPTVKQNLNLNGHTTNENGWSKVEKRKKKKANKIEAGKVEVSCVTIMHSLYMVVCLRLMFGVSAFRSEPPSSMETLSVVETTTATVVILPDPDPISIPSQTRRKPRSKHHHGFIQVSHPRFMYSNQDILRRHHAVNVDVSYHFHRLWSKQVF